MGRWCVSCGRRLSPSAGRDGALQGGASGVPTGPSPPLRSSGPSTEPSLFSTKLGLPLFGLGSGFKRLTRSRSLGLDPTHFLRRRALVHCEPTGTADSLHGLILLTAGMVGYPRAPPRPVGLRASEARRTHPKRPTPSSRADAHQTVPTAAVWSLVHSGWSVFPHPPDLPAQLQPHEVRSRVSKRLP